MEPALAGRPCQGSQSTSDAAPGLLAYVAHHLGAHHAPALFHGPPARVKAVASPRAAKPRAAAKAAPEAHERCEPGPRPGQGVGDAPQKRGPGRPPQAAASLEQRAQAVQATRLEHQRLSAPRAQVAPSLRPSGQVDHWVDFERGGRRHGQLMAADSHAQMDTRRRGAHHAGLSQPCVERIDKAARVVPPRKATIALVAGSGRPPVRQLDLPPRGSYARPAPRRPSCSLERVAQTRTVSAGEPLRERAARRRTPLVEPGGACAELSEAPQHQRHHQATELAAVFPRSSSKVEGRHGSRSLRPHQRRGRDRPRKRACLRTVHHFCLTRAEGTTAAERFFGQQPRSRFAAIWASVALPPAPLSPPRRAEG
jgi:hypothetical protein